MVVHGGVTVRVVEDVVRVVVQCVEVLVQSVADVFVTWPPFVTIVGFPPFVEVTVWYTVLVFLEPLRLALVVLHAGVGQVVVTDFVEVDVFVDVQVVYRVEVVFVIVIVPVPVMVMVDGLWQVSFQLKTKTS